MPALAILNTAILTADGAYELRTITLDEARRVIQEANDIDSAVGHQATADILTELLGRDVPVNRQQFAHQLGQHAIVFKLRGRAPEGVILDRAQIEAIGYDLKVLTRLS